MAETETQRCGACKIVWSYFTLITRVWGILTAVGLWGIGIEVCDRRVHVEIGVYLIFTAIVVTFFETMFLLDPCAKKCCSEESCLNKCWTSLAWIDNWKRCILYVLLSIVCFLNPKTVWMAVISGIMLLVSATLHGLHTLKDARDTNMKSVTNKNYRHFCEVQGDDMEASIGGARTAGAIHNVHNIEPLFSRTASDEDSNEREKSQDALKDERTELKRSNSFDLGTGSAGLVADDHIAGTLEI